MKKVLLLVFLICLGLSNIFQLVAFAFTNDKSFMRTEPVGNDKLRYQYSFQKLRYSPPDNSFIVGTLSIHNPLDHRLSYFLGEPDTGLLACIKAEKTDSLAPFYINYEKFWVEDWSSILLATSENRIDINSKQTVTFELALDTRYKVEKFLKSFIGKRSKLEADVFQSSWTTIGQPCNVKAFTPLGKKVGNFEIILP